MASYRDRLINHGDGLRMAQALESIAEKMSDGTSAVVYGIKIDKNNSDPSTRITYTDAAAGMTPVHMDFTNGTFDYGSWENSAIVKSNYSCMVKYDGTEDYKLNPANLTLKEDGTASDVANTAYGGNAMAAFVGGYLDHHEDSNYEYIRWSNVKADSNFHAYHRTDSNGVLRPGFYWNIFPVSSIDSKARSISGQTPMASVTAPNERTACQANGTDWDMSQYSEWDYIISLLKILGKSENLQAVYGQGNSTSGQSGVLAGGTLNAKGAFFGYSGTTSAVKVFNVEHLWGNQWIRILGLINKSGELLVQPFGTYNMAGDGYKDIGKACADGGWVKDSFSNQYGRFPKAVGGSDSTYWCDYYWINTGITAVAFVGGSSGSGSSCGACVDLSYPASNAYWYVAPCLSRKMLAA